MATGSSLFSFDEMVSTLRTRFPHLTLERVEEIARKECGLSALIAEPVVSPRDASIAEKAEQSEIVKRFKGIGGFAVYNLSQSRASKQTPGLPDLWCMHTRYAFAFWWESKRQVGGEFSDAQLTFAKLSADCGIAYGCGDHYDAESYLIALGLAERHGESLEPLRPAVLKLVPPMTPPTPETPRA